MRREGPVSERCVRVGLCPLNAEPPCLRLVGAKRPSPSEPSSAGIVFVCRQRIADAFRFKGDAPKRQPAATEGLGYHRDRISTRTMKIATFNVNGINGRLSVLLRWLAEAEPDIVCLQE